MHKFFRGSKKTIAAMMAVLMFTSSTGGYAQAGMIQDAFPETQEIVQDVQGNTDTPVTEDAETVVTKPETEVQTKEPAEDSAEGSVDTTTPEVTETPKPTEKLEEKNKDASKETTADSEKKSETSEKKETSEDSNELSNTVTRFIQEKDSYAYMEQITNMDDLLSEMNEEQLYELLYFMRLSFLSEVPEDHSQTLDAYYEILEAYLKVKSQDPKQEWQALVLPYLPYYKEGMETTEEYLNAVDGKDFDLSGLEEQLAALEETTDFDMLPAEEKKVTVEAAMESARQDIRDGKPEDAVWTMYHYGYLADVLLELDAESLEAFFQGLDNENRYVFHALAGYEYFGFVDQGYALDGYKEKADMLRYYYQECKENQVADQLLLKALNDQNRTSYASVDAYEADLEAGSSEDFASVMEAWNLYLSGRLDVLAKKAEKEDIRETPAEKKNPQEPSVPDDPETSETPPGETKKTDGTTPGGTLSDIAYPAMPISGQDIATCTVTGNGIWVPAGSSWYYMVNGQPVKGDWIYVGSKYYYARPSDGHVIVGETALIGNKGYYFDAKGVMQTGTFQFNNETYVTDSNGVIQEGWIPDTQITGKYYYVRNFTAQYGWLMSSGTSAPDAGGNTSPWYYCGTASDRWMRRGGYFNDGTADYYFDQNGHCIAAMIDLKGYYSLFNDENGALDQAGNGDTIVLMGGRNSTAKRNILTKNLTLTSDGDHRSTLVNTSTGSGNERASLFWMNHAALTVTGAITLDGGDKMGETYANDVGDVMVAGTDGTITVNSPDVQIRNCNHGISSTSDGGNSRINFLDGEIYDCQFGIGAYHDVNMEGGTIRDCLQAVHLNAYYNDITCTITGGVLRDSKIGLAGFTATWEPVHKGTEHITVQDAEICNITESGIFLETLSNESTLKVDGAYLHNNGTGITVHEGCGSLEVGKNSQVRSVDNDTNGIWFDNADNTAYVDQAVLTGNGGDTWDGGGIYSAGPLTTTGNTVVSKNTAPNGGGVYSEKELTMDGSEISGNSAEKGGGIYVNGTATVNAATVTGNSSTNGGGIWDQGDLTLTGSEISSNTATQDGGGVSIDTKASLTVDQSELSKNTARDGGGLYNAGTLNVQNTSITDNQASGTDGHGLGGGICTYGDMTLTGQTVISRNTATDGGGIAGEEVEMDLSVTLSSNTASNNGGGVYSESGDVTCSGGTIKDNTAAYGGGAYLLGGTFAMENGTVSGNEASKKGGGLLLDSLEDAVLSGGSLTGNRSKADGSALYLASCEAAVTGGSMTGNTAEGDGAIYVATDASVSVQGGTVSSNTAKRGGAIYNAGTTTLTGGRILGNTAGTGAAIYQNGTLKAGDDAAVSGDIFLCKDHLINVISDLAVADLEVSMTEEDTFLHRVIAEYASSTDAYKNGTDDTGRYSLEKNTDAYAQAKRIGIADNGTKGQSYQVWLDWNTPPIRVNYIGRYAQTGSVKSEVVTPDVTEYTVRKNAKYTEYGRDNFSFLGWGTHKDDISKPVYAEKTANKVSYDDLLEINRRQQAEGITGEMFQTGKDTADSSRTVLSAAQSLLSGLIFPVQVQAADSKVLDVYMLDTWDEYPEIKWTENTFWEGTDVIREDLLQNIQIKDNEDGDIDVNNLVIHSITYSEGKLEGGKKGSSYTVDYPDGMKDTDQLDTWFLKLDKDDSPVTHIMHCSVTDSAGNVTKADIPVKVKYNEFPTIDARDRYFTLEEAQSGQITEKALLQDAITDGKLSADDTEEGNMNDRLEMVDFNADDFTSFTDSGYVTVTFHVQDSMGPGGKGKETYRQIKVYVVKDGVIEEPEKAQNIRFINKKYYDLNKGVDPDTLTEEEKEARNGNGGLNVESKWYHDPEYQAVIEAAFGKTQGTDYEFTKEDIDKIKAYVDANGIGTTKSDAALDNFYSQFVAPAKVN